MKLYEDMKEKCDISYMTSRKLNQDILENAFNYIKGMTGSASNCITSLDFKYWFAYLPKSIDLISIKLII